jgi:beta-galactosidase
MKSTKVFFKVILLFVALSFTQKVMAQRQVKFNNGWKFHLGSLCNAEQVDYDDSSWRTINLPHDWGVEPVQEQIDGITIGPFSKMSEKRYPAIEQKGGGAWDVGQTKGGEGWYRKTFTTNIADTGKIITLYVEAASYQSEIWVNNTKVYFNHYAYTPYRVDITNLLKRPGQNNVIAIKTVNEGHNSRWYVGSGIYRNVYLIKTQKIYLDKWDTYINASKIAKGKALVKFSSIVHHRIDLPHNIYIRLKIFSPEGFEIYNNSIMPEINDSVRTNVYIDKPEKWYLNSPKLYSAELILYNGITKIDSLNIPFGIRTISFTAKDGFKLNGEKILLKGCCIHHDNGLLGAAAIEQADYHKVELLKANGFNAVRCSHNLASEYFYEACDRLGMLVIHETFDQWMQSKRLEDYHQYFPKYHLEDLVAGVKRDRNHPCIIMWSIGNEIPDRADSAGVVIGKELGNTIRSLVASPYITMGINDFWDRKNYNWDKDVHRVCSYLDVCGYNYMWKKYETDHKVYPDRVIFGSESFPKEADLNWNLVERLPYVVGDFVWTAIDYVGEAGLGHTLQLEANERSPQFMDWPWFNSWCGDLDLIGEKKPQSYYRDVLWRNSPITMAVSSPIAPGKHEDVNLWGWPDERQSWTWNGCQGQNMEVHVYSRSHKVRLILNDKLVGIKETDRSNYTAIFHIPYEPGVLIASNVGEDNSEFTLRTASEPSQIILRADRTEITSSPDDLSYIKICVADDKGNVVPNATVPLKIEVLGDANVIAGNGSFDDMKSFRSMTPFTFRGKALAIVRPIGKSGKITLQVSSKGLKAQKITIIMK